MEDKPGTYPILCPITLIEASRVSQMIESHDEFSGIEIALNLDPPPAIQIPEGKTLVIFEIPCEGIDMVNFFREFYGTLVTLHRERMG